jgi:hypothetical protein
MFKQTSPQSVIKMSGTGHLRFHFQWQLFLVMSRMVLVSASTTSAVCIRHTFIFNLSIDELEIKYLYDLRDVLSRKIMSGLIPKQYIAVMLLCFTLLRHVKECIHPQYSQSHLFIYSLTPVCGMRCQSLAGFWV